MYLNRQQCKKRQSGFLMPLALFVVVGLGALAVAVTRFSSGSFNSVVQEAISVQTFYAADAGAQYAMHQILHDPSDLAGADASCAAVDGHTINFPSGAFPSCTVQLNCMQTASAGGTPHIYTIDSLARCGTSELQTQRHIRSAASFSE